MRARIESALGDNHALLINPATGKAWTQREFDYQFAKVRTIVAKTHPEMADLQFRDLRRTCVVRLGELGMEINLISAITGHSLEHVHKILEVYMPRNTKMAARAVAARSRYRQRIAA